MIDVDIPDFGPLRMEHLVLDYNGTLACDGELFSGVPERLVSLSDRLTVHVVTADTFGRAKSGLAGLPVSLTILEPGRQSEAKAAYIEALGPETTVAIGNGRNDRLMLKQAALGILVIESEGAAIQSIAAADVCTTAIVPALDLLLYPKRLVATLRS